jgi:hypothetical protein
MSQPTAPGLARLRYGKHPSRCWRAVALVLNVWISGACHRPVKFTHSSLDHNRARPHAVRVAARRLGHVLDRLVPIARQRDLKLVEQHRCSERRCLLVFSSADRSRYFISVRRVADGQYAVAATGVPTIQGIMACPEYFQRANRCTARSILPLRHGNLSKDSGRDVSGALEAKIIDSVLSRLSLSSPKRRLQQRPRRRPVVAVLDIDDQSSAHRRAVVDQLSRYLSAVVAEQPVFRLVPQERLRSELARRRRDSYRPCYQQQCQIEIGKALAADRVLATTLLRVGTRCTLTSMLFDLRTEATELATSIRSACTEDELVRSIDRLVRRLSQQARSSSG